MGAPRGVGLSLYFSLVFGCWFGVAPTTLSVLAPSLTPSSLGVLTTDEVNSLPLSIQEWHGWELDGPNVEGLAPVFSTLTPSSNYERGRFRIPGQPRQQRPRQRDGSQVIWQRAPLATKDVHHYLAYLPVLFNTFGGPDVASDKMMCQFESPHGVSVTLPIIEPKRPFISIVVRTKTGVNPTLRSTYDLMIEELSKTPACTPRLLLFRGDREVPDDFFYRSVVPNNEGYFVCFSLEEWSWLSPTTTEPAQVVLKATESTASCSYTIKHISLIEEHPLSTQCPSTATMISVSPAPRSDQQSSGLAEFMRREHEKDRLRSNSS